MNIKKNVIKLFKANKFIYIILKLLFAKNRKQYREIIYDYIENDNVFWFQKLGKLNQNKKFMYISVGDNDTDKIDARTVGFFALLNVYVMPQLDIADKLNLEPFIYWGQSVPFSENEIIDGTDNVFEYYFKQNIEDNREDILTSYNVCLSYALSKGLSKKNTNYDRDSTMLNRYAYLYNKYIFFNTQVKKELDIEMEKIGAGVKTLGIHVRGVEWGNVENHPNPVSLSIYFEHIDNLFKRKKYNSIFLATDSQETLQLFIDKYGTKVNYYEDASRTEKGSKQLIIFNKKQKEKHRGNYNLGFEVLRDMLTLSYCGGLLAGLSNVSFTARYVKGSRGESYDDEIIINNGIFTDKGLSMKECLKEQNKMN